MDDRGTGSTGAWSCLSNDLEATTMKTRNISLVRMALTLPACIVSIMLVSCGKSDETEKLRAELERLKGEAVKQQLRKEVGAIKECTLKGSVFIVTKGGTNFKLGLLHIVIADSDLIQEHLKTTFESLERVSKDYRAKFDAKNLALAEAVKALRPYLSKVGQANDALSLARTHLEKHANVYDALYRVDMRYGAVEADYQASASEFQKALENYRVAAAELKPHLEKATAAYEDAASERRLIASLIDSHMDSVFSNLPSIETLKTNADGEFQVKLPRGKTIFVAGRGQRSVGKENETYFWLNRVTLPDKDEFTLLMSNDTLLDSIPMFSDKLFAVFPDKAEPPPSFDMNKAMSGWEFKPSVNVPLARDAQQEKMQTKRDGNTIVLGTRIRADILDESGAALGFAAFNPGESIEIQREDADYFYFSRKGKPHRVKKVESLKSP
jgi:hypothetical protein